MYLEQFELLLCQGAVLIENSLRHKPLSNIVDPSGKTDLANVGRREAKSTSDHLAILRDGLAMPGRIDFASLSCARQLLNRIPEQCGFLLFGTGRQLAERSHEFLKMLRAGALALQEAFNVSGDQLAVHRDR